VQPDPDFDLPKHKQPFKPLGYKWILDSLIKERDLYTLSQIKLEQGYSPSEVKEYLEDVRQLKHWSEGREIIALRVLDDYYGDTSSASAHLWVHQRCIVISFRHRKIYLSEISQTHQQKQIENPDYYGDPLEYESLETDEPEGELTDDKMDDFFEQSYKNLDLDDQIVKTFSELKDTAFKNTFKENSKDEISEDIQEQESDLSLERKLDKELQELLLNDTNDVSEIENEIDQTVKSLKDEGNLEDAEVWESFKSWIKRNKDNTLNPKVSFDTSGLSWNEVPQFLLSKGLAIPQDNVNELEKIFTAKEPLPLPSLENNDPNSFSEEQLDEHIQKHGLDKIITWDQLTPSSQEPFSKQSPLRSFLPDVPTPTSTKANKLFRMFRRIIQRGATRNHENDLESDIRTPRARHRCKLFSIPPDFLEAMKRVPWPADQSLLIEDFFEHVSHKGEVIPRQRPPILGAMQEDEKFDVNFNLNVN
jgi:hypothetical protein